MDAGCFAEGIHLAVLQMVIQQAEACGCAVAQHQLPIHHHFHCETPLFPLHNSLQQRFSELILIERLWGCRRPCRCCMCYLSYQRTRMRLINKGIYIFNKHVGCSLLAGAYGNCTKQESILLLGDGEGGGLPGLGYAMHQ